MADDTNTAGLKALQEYLKDCDDNAIIPDVGGAWHAAFQAGRASLAASAGSEPVATIKSWTNGSYWRNYKVEWHRNDLPEGAQLYTHPSPPEGMAGLPTRNELALQLLVAGGFVAEKKLAEALALVDAACPALSPPLPASEAKEL